ncbi:MAG TPA: DUF4349 domain-containing protein [Solirubrobacterales bacterium]|jgi:hypothetical protein|nr:DUF4349 domain-containing protein [Solirubrobacterales bacterium]
MDRFDDDTLFAELRELRPTPRPEFTADLDERAAAGFPRRSSPSAATMPFALLADRWRALSPRRRLVPVLAAAFAVLAVATAVVAIAEKGTNSNPADEAVVGLVPGPGESGRSAEETSGGGAAAGPHRHGAEKSGSHGGTGGGSSHSAAGGNNPGEAVYETEVPSVTNAPATKAGKSAAGAPAAGVNGSSDGAPVEAEESAAAGGEETSGGGAEHFPEEAEESADGNATKPFDAEIPPLTHRDIERSAYVVLGTKPGEVSSAAGRVYEAVHAAHGVVLHSKVQSGSAGATGADFELLIPSGKLDDALAAFSQIAEVRERHDATDDITAPTVGAAEELRDSNASIEGLLKELGQVETEAQRESVEARLREERRHHAAIRAHLDRLGKRASMSEVTVRIVTSHGAGVTPPRKDDGSWGVGDALHDAGHILTIAAGVVLIALAVLAPIALIVFLFWAANRVRVRRLRERTLS